MTSNIDTPFALTLDCFNAPFPGGNCNAEIPRICRAALVLRHRVVEPAIRGQVRASGRAGAPGRLGLDLAPGSA